MPEHTLAEVASNPTFLPIPLANPQVVPWNIDQFQARDVWDANRDGTVDPGAPDGSNMTVCIIDTGIYASHDDFVQGRHGSPYGFPRPRNVTK